MKEAFYEIKGFDTPIAIDVAGSESASELLSAPICEC